jgi:uncharacterized membrane protein
MPDIGVFHPQIVHFVVALLIVGVVARVLSLLPLPKALGFLSPMAAALILLGTVAAAAAFHSGMGAHGPAERVPGARQAVVEHEEWGERTRNAFLWIGGIELVALAFASRKRVRKALHVIAALGGIAGLWVLYETAEHGGEVVYAYAGGVGTRSGEPADLRRLLVAGLYHNLQAARREDRREDAARLTDELLRQMPEDPDARLLGIESKLRDRDDARGALADLAALPPGDDTRLESRRTTLIVESHRALGAMDSATAAIADLQRRFPNDRRVQQTVARLTGGTATARP